MRKITSLYPQDMDSFLDIGCCRGAYVIEASQRPRCRTAVGIDVHEPFVSTASLVKEHLGIHNAHFHLATLEDLTNDPAAYGGPFHTVLLIGTYHYLFWGSVIDQGCYLNHEKILSMVSRTCTPSVIMSARFEVKDCPQTIKQKAKELGDKVIYNTEHFVEKAEELFEVRKVGHLGRYPIFLMLRRN
ncbi:MAG: class I SAM-dependent methyltransferase [Phycisphaerae bacterium]|nr:class I SAM-dependent methyltransferase [Phycisphaerae bacterium]